MTEPSPRTPLSAVLLTVGGVGAAFAAASCCGLPFLLASTGIGFAWLTGLAIFSAPYRPLLLAAAAVCLLGGAALLWRQQKVARACSVRTTRGRRDFGHTPWVRPEPPAGPSCAV